MAILAFETQLCMIPEPIKSGLDMCRMVSMHKKCAYVYCESIPASTYRKGFESVKNLTKSCIFSFLKNRSTTSGLSAIVTSWNSCIYFCIYGQPTLHVNVIKNDGLP